MIIEVRWSVRWSGYDRTGDKMVDLDLDSGGGIERVFTAAGKQHDALKKSTMDKTLESTLKAGMNIKLSTCDDKGVFTDDEGTYRKRK